MNKLLALTAIAFAASIILSAFYWGIVRPVLLTRIQYQIYALRDSLRRQAIEGAVSHRKFVYQYLEDLMNKSIVFFPTTSIISLLRLRSSTLSAATVRFNNEANDAMKAVRDAARGRGMQIVLINSPWFAMILGVAWLCEKFHAPKRDKLEESTERFAVELPRSEPLNSSKPQFAYCL